jgi:DNA-binding transcriptional LysR family regulator
MAEQDIHRYLRHGTLPQLRVFEASARLGSFSRAAEELHLSQPTASVQIRKLSDTVGVALFEQVGRRIYLTAAGERLYQGCQEIFRAFRSFHEALGELRTLRSGSLHLAVSTTAMSFVPRLLRAFLTSHPSIEASVVVHNRLDLLRRLSRNEDDLYLFASTPEADDVVIQELLPNPLVVLARDDHPLAREARIPFARFAQEPLLLREEGSGTRRIALRLFAEHGLAPAVRMELGSNEAIREAILEGLGVAIISRHTYGLDPESARYRCLDVEGFPLENHWYLAYPGGKRLKATTRAFLDLARAEAKQLIA